MKFYFKSQKSSGEVYEGFAEAQDKFALARDLRKSGDVPLVVRESKDKKPGALSFSGGAGGIFGGHVKLQEKIMFTKNLAGMLSAGLPLSRALGIMEKQTKNIKFKSVLHSIVEDVNKGDTLSASMQKFPKVFPMLFISMVKAGEESGGLAKALLEVGTNLDKSYALKRKVKGAMTYPLVIVIAMGLIGVLMFIFVVPTLVSTFKDMGADLPATTKFIIFLSDNISGHPFIFLGVIGVVIALFAFAFRLKSVQRGFDYMVVRLPAIGLIAKQVNAARTTRTLSSLLDAGVSMTRCLEITRDVLQNVFYQDIIDTAIVSVQKGVALSAVFKARTDLYPVMVGEMMEVGEETGKLSSMLADIAAFYEEEVDSKTKNLSTIVEPMLMIFIGGAVGFFAVSIIQPLYSIGSAIK